MSAIHLEMIRERLLKKGWSILNEVPEYDQTGGLYDVYDETIHWVIVRNPILKPIEITFYLFDKLGRRTKDLSDILYGQTDSDSKKLYFDNVKSEEWKTSLELWINNLDQINLSEP